MSRVHLLIQRIIEEAEGYRALTDKCFLTQEEVARKVGKHRSTVANLLRLLNLPLEIQDFLRRGQLGMGHARALLGLDADDDTLELGRRAVEKKMTPREVEKAVKYIGSESDAKIAYSNLMWALINSKEFQYNH